MSAPPDLRRDWDVIIIGGRVAGASTALLLALAGARVLVVERARRGSDTVSTHALMRGGVPAASLGPVRSGSRHRRAADPPGHVPLWP